MANNVTIKARQTLADIAIQKGGSLEAWFEVAALNGMGITDSLVTDQIIAAPAVMVAEVADYFRKYKLFPASASTSLNDLVPEGVEFWGIEYDFIIS